jgi:putative hydrolase of the HAD superfamily
MQAQLLAESMNIDTEEAYRRIEGIMYRKWEKIFETIKPYASIPPVLEDLKKRGFKLAVLSDFPVNTKLAYLDLEGFWDCALASEEAGYLKPNPEPFMLLAECLDLRPEQILYVGNSYEYDIVGANKAGMKTGYFAKRGKKPGKADIIFSSYKNLVLNIEEKMGNM